MQKSTPLLLIALILITPSAAFAVGSAGFENASFSANQIAEGGAVVAQAEEPAAISYNPAGLTSLEGIQVQTNLGLISTFTRHSNGGNSSYSSGTISPVPTGYVSINPGELLWGRVALGVGADSPFGLSNKYNSNHPTVHYTGYKNYLKMYSIKPVVALELHEKLSIAAGPVYYRVYDFGGIQAYPNVLLGGAFPDGEVRVNLAGNRWGWHTGLLYKPHKQHQLGVYFRSPVTINTRGKAEIEGATVNGNFQTGADAKLDLPLNITVGYVFKPTDDSAIELDFGYTRWSAYKRLYINTAPVDAANNGILAAIGKADKDYSDSFSLHLGGHKKLNKKLTLRAGSFFYWAAVPNDHYVPSVPDANRLAFTAGSSYEIIKNLSFDIAYLAELGLRRSINNNISETLGTSVDGKYFSYIQGLYLTLSYKWDIFKQSEEKDTNNKSVVS